VRGEVHNEDSYNEDNPNCERTYAELRLYSGQVEPGEVTARVGIAPTEQRRRGSESVNSLGRPVTHPRNAWFLSSEHHVHSKEIRRHLDWLLPQLIEHRFELAELKKEPDVRMWICCLWWSATGDGGPTLSPVQMEAMAQLGLDCCFELAFYTEETL